MTQRDELAGALGGHDAGNAGHAQHIAFLHGAALHSGECLGVHGDDAVGGGLPEGDGLLAHVHHHGVAGGIKVGQIGFRCIHIFTLSFVQPLSLVASSSTAPLVGEPLAKPFTLRGLPKPPLDRGGGIASAMTERFDLFQQCPNPQLGQWHWAQPRQRPPSPRRAMSSAVMASSASRRGSSRSKMVRLAYMTQPGRPQTGTPSR